MEDPKNTEAILQLAWVALARLEENFNPIEETAKMVRAFHDRCPTVGGLIHFRQAAKAWLEMYETIAKNKPSCEHTTDESYCANCGAPQGAERDMIQDEMLLDDYPRAVVQQMSPAELRKAIKSEKGQR